ncbi:MAG TPA: hypothetical protein VEB86_07620 [Chryseosolibacter sp.]|nr:hypothetical protein [Chryseosolibacter sp.]
MKMNISPFLSAFRSLGGSSHPRKSTRRSYAFLQRKFNALRYGEMMTHMSSARKKVRTQTPKVNVAV